jgi:uncharacterized protein Gcw-chp
MRTIAWSLLLAGFVSATAAAQQGASSEAASQVPIAAPAPAQEAAPSKRMTVTMGIDFTSAYLFRGIRQHSGGTIAQPVFDLGVSLGRGVSANVGNWDSLHSSAPSGTWYESDYYGSVTFSAGKLKPGVLYTSYTSPSDSFSTVKELAGVLSIDDSSSPVPFSPRVMLAFELSDGQADGGAKKGTYLELAAKPSVKLANRVSLVVPLKAGFSLKDYYEGPLGSNTFGFFDTGVQLSVPAVSGRNGSLEIHGGIDFLWLGDNLKVLNQGNGFKPIGLIGFVYTY